MLIYTDGISMLYSPIVSPIFNSSKLLLWLCIVTNNVVPI
jgi:hypothetical protein